MKKIFIFLLLIIIIILCLLFVLIDPMYNRKNSLNISDIEILLSKSGQSSNYYYEVEESSSNVSNTSNDNNNNVIKREYFIKDNLIKEILTMQDGGKSIYWQDINTGELIMIYYNQKKIIVTNTNLGTLGISSEAKQNNIDLSTNMKYKFLGRTTINSRSTVVVKLYTGLNKEYYYIDEDTGIIIKTVYKELFHSSADTKKILFNSVSDKDVLKPDLKEYTEYQIENIEK